jgi:hypothetical protein
MAADYVLPAVLLELALVLAGHRLLRSLLRLLPPSAARKRSINVADDEVSHTVRTTSRTSTRGTYVVRTKTHFVSEHDVTVVIPIVHEPVPALQLIGPESVAVFEEEREPLVFVLVLEFP